MDARLRTVRTSDCATRSTAGIGEYPRREPALPSTVACHVDPATQAKLAVDTGEVGLNGLHADEQSGGNLGVTAAGCHGSARSRFGRSGGPAPAGREPRPLRLGQFLPAPGTKAAER